MRVAAIDCGTNSIRLLIAEAPDPQAAAVSGSTDVHREVRIVRLGQGVDGTGRLAPEAIERTRVALADYAATIRRLPVDGIRMVATSATRDAENRAEFTAMVRATLGVEPEVVSGLEEAALTFGGAASGLTRAERTSQLLVADIGGGSTELVLGRLSERATLQAYSLDIGAVRITERHLHDDPPTALQVARATDDVRLALSEARGALALDRSAALVGVAGTVTTVAALALALTEYDSARIHAAVLTAEQILSVTGRLLTMTRTELAAQAVIHAGRVDVIAGGALILREVITELGASELTVSEHDILDGIALSAFAALADVD